MANSHWEILWKYGSWVSGVTGRRSKRRRYCPFPIQPNQRLGSETSPAFRGLIYKFSDAGGWIVCRKQYLMKELKQLKQFQSGAVMLFKNFNSFKLFNSFKSLRETQ
jgi:hypothetical protein